MRRLVWLALALAVVVFLPACATQKRTAETMISTAETALAEVKDKAMNIAPDQVKAIEDAIVAAKASVEQGDFKTAIDTTKDLPAKVQEMSGGLDAKMQELQAGWEGLNAGLPGAVAALDKKVGSMRRAPSGMDAAKWDALKASVAGAKTTWGEALAAQQAGNWAAAVTKGTEVKTAVMDAMTSLKMPLPKGM